MFMLMCVQIEKGTDKPCVSAAILKDEESKLTGVEVSSICLSLVSGGFETIPGTLTSCIGSLSTPEGQIFQERAYEDIKRHHPGIESAWEKCLEAEDVPYVNAIVKEAGRYYTVSSMSLPRKAAADIEWDGAIIPKGTMILINAQAANHEVEHFGPDAGKFNPERFLSSLSPPEEVPATGLQHHSVSRIIKRQYLMLTLLFMEVRCRRTSMLRSIHCKSNAVSQNRLRRTIIEIVANLPLTCPGTQPLSDSSAASRLLPV